MANLEQNCTVVSRKVTLEDVEEILDIQANTRRPNSRDSQIDAFSKTLQGSKVYLKEHGLLNETTED